MFRRVIAALALLLLAAALLVAGWPQLLGLQTQTGVAQLVSLRALAGGMAAVAVVVLLVIALASRSARRFCASAAVLLLVFVGLSAAVLASRGWGSEHFAAKGEGGVTVLSWNTLGDAPGADRIATLALDNDADIVVLPETSVELAQQIADRMGAEGRTMAVHNITFDQIAKARTTSLLISSSLGRYVPDSEAGSTRVIPSGLWRPADGDGPAIVAGHPVAPVPGEMPAWREGLEWLAARCQEPDLIMAGDLNSTIDHWSHLAGEGELGDCHDGAKATGDAAVGTWPTRIPAEAGAPIDHVLAGSDWRFTGFRVVRDQDHAGSDHRPVIAQLERVS
ncbi:endonuclease/exonuclease/phosphatase family protein [Schumannella sp. 10F1B-5-1]|uniref:endonuclease/exonuclease/phosphatase family protein n=1 Tax=Schumannella sp. 10F1B-5-1 TaxID=2590780 RepID=UPI00113020A2|nr:endonuclease/exonuclease/phosphatase family protein [Schumannella sp. 10F1B-5-1]TPW73146.1 endonuclease/exonuclease/phosphatase family protein [Schumannella sp. 10F1B-5-1]